MARYQVKVVPLNMGLQKTFDTRVNKEEDHIIVRLGFWVYISRYYRPTTYSAINGVNETNEND